VHSIAYLIICLTYVFLHFVIPYRSIGYVFSLCYLINFTLFYLFFALFNHSIAYWFIDSDVAGYFQCTDRYDRRCFVADSKVITR